MDKDVRVPRTTRLREARDLAPADAALSREALVAAMPESGNGSTDLVGWAAQTRRSRAGALPRGRARALLATALGVAEDALAQMTDADVARAVDRIRGLADQCHRLAGQVTIDELTGALRRGAGMAALQREIDRSRRIGDRGLVLVFIDVDGLKSVNDRDGHAAGDDLLRNTVAAVRDRLRSYDLVIRYGGDEFLCVLTGTTIAQAQRTARLLRDHVAARTAGSISTGLAALADDDTVATLVERADAALYAGRRARGSTEREVGAVAREHRAN